MEQTLHRLKTPSHRRVVTRQTQRKGSKAHAQLNAKKSSKNICFWRLMEKTLHRFKTPLAPPCFNIDATVPAMGSRNKRSSALAPASILRQRGGGKGVQAMRRCKVFSINRTGELVLGEVSDMGFDRYPYHERVGANGL